MIYAKEQTMIDWMKNLCRPPSPQAMALRELETARREKLDAESGVDYAKSVVDYNNARIERLENFLYGETK
jgi:hypothetical protein